MTLLPILALGAKIAYFSFTTSTFEWLNKVILQFNLGFDRSIVTLVQHEVKHYNYKHYKKLSRSSLLSLSIMYQEVMQKNYER